MKVILYMAVSVDGFVATRDGDSDWVSEVDQPIFNGKIKKIGCVAMGRITFDQYHGQLFPKKDALNIVVTSNTVENKEEGVKFVKNPYEAVKTAEEAGFSELLVIGGGTVNGSFLKEKLIDEIFLDAHPLILGNGIKLFEDYENFLKVELLESSNLDGGQVLLHYKVIK